MSAAPTNPEPRPPDTPLREDAGEGPSRDGPGRVEDVGQTSPQDELVAELIEHTIDVPVLASAVAEQEAADAADTLETLQEEQAADVLEQMDDRTAAEALAEMQGPLAAGVLQDLVEEDLAYAARLVSLMAPDDAADLLQAVDETAREEVLAVMGMATAAALRKLIGYDRESAGGMMTTEYLALRKGMTVAEATEAVRARAIPETVQHLLVVADDNRLVGIVSLRDLLINPAGRTIDELMKDTVKAVRPDLDREHVAREFDRYDYAMLPVVDLDDRLIGMVTVDDVIDIIRAEHTEDVQMTVGAGAFEAVYSGVTEKFRGRFPWLTANMLLAGLAALALLVFHDMIAERPLLAYIGALIAPVVGNAGHQALAVTLRGIVLDEVRRGRVVPLLAREAAVGGLVGGTLGALMAVTLAVIEPRWGASWQMGVVSGASMAVAMMAGTFAGAGVPLAMHRLGADPAHASAIVLILITDAVSYTAFLALAFALASWMI
jgi:magnesium transporter